LKTLSRLMQERDISKLTGVVYGKETTDLMLDYAYNDLNLNRLAIG